MMCSWWTEHCIIFALKFTSSEITKAVGTLFRFLFLWSIFLHSFMFKILVFLYLNMYLISGYVCVCVCVYVSYSVVWLFVIPLTVAPRLLCRWNSPGENTGVGCHSFLQRILPTQGSNLGLLHCRPILYHLRHQGSPVHTWVRLKSKI